MAGRFERTYTAHRTFAEIEQAFDWNEDQYVWFGDYPRSNGLVEEEGPWKAYVQQSLIKASISMGILTHARVDKPALLRRLFELGCPCSGRIFSYTNMLGHLKDAGNTTTLSHFLELLDTAGFLAGIERYAEDIIRKRSSIPKFQVHNTARIIAQRPEFPRKIRTGQDEWGRMAESAIGP